MAAFDTIMFVARDKIDFYFGGKILTFPFLPVFVKDLEIVDKDAFRTQLLTFAEKNEITFGTCAILLSDSVCFISEPISEKQNPEDALNPFLANLPFESPTARILGDRIVGTNRDLYQAILDVVGGKGGRIKMVSPSFLSEEIYGKKGLDEEMVNLVSKNESEYIKATFNYEAPLPVQKEPGTRLQKRSKREMVLIGVFGALLLVFIIWVLTASL